MTTVAARLGVTRLDAALAAGFVVAGLVQVSIWPIADHGLGHLYVLGTTLPLAWRRARPVVSSFVSTLPWVVPLDGFPVLGFVVVILQFFALGSRGAPRTAVAATTAWAVAAGAAGTLLGPEDPIAAIGAALVAVAPVLAGQLVAHERRQNAELARLADRLQEERRRAEASAVESERARIAQELHDVVGHEVTLIAVQAEAASAALRLAPERAAEPVEAIRVTAHRTLAEIRGVLDVLSGGEEVPPIDPGDLDELARRAQEAGIANTLTVTGTPSDHAQTRLAVNRIVRECLTNAGRHAPGRPITIEVDWQAERVLVAASNPVAGGRPPEPGRGLTGMRHRAELLGGTFEATVRDGRFDVRVVLPS